MRRFYWTGVAQLGPDDPLFKREGVEQHRHGRQGHKANVLHPPWKLFTLAARLADHLVLVLSPAARDNRDDTLLLGLIDEFARDGLQFRFRPEPLPGVARANPES